MVGLRRSSNEDWTAIRVRIRKVDTEEPSQTFVCAAHLEDEGGSQSNVQFCVLELASASPEVVAETSPAATSCTCFREFTVVQDRVMICTSDGCFSTSTDADNGWSDMPVVQHLFGIGTDGVLYGATSENTTVHSRNAGLTWEPSLHTVEIATPVLDYFFDVNHLTTIPKDVHVRTRTQSLADISKRASCI
jgi:hypothetical protein